jgi:hypothetical protein
LSGITIFVAAPNPFSAVGNENEGKFGAGGAQVQSLQTGFLTKAM